MTRTKERYSAAELTKRHIEAGKSSYERDLQKEVEYYKNRHDKLVTSLATPVKITKDDPKGKLIPTISELLFLYAKAKPTVKLTWLDGDVIICKDWFATKWMFCSYKGENDFKDGDQDIEVDIDPDEPLIKGQKPFDNTDPKFTFMLKDPAYLSVKDKAEYYALCKIIYVNGNLVTKVDTPSSLLWLLRNGVDAFDLIENGLAERV